jgi:hypothetical protein
MQLKHALKSNIILPDNFTILGRIYICCFWVEIFPEVEVEKLQSEKFLAGM